MSITGGNVLTTSAGHGFVEGDILTFVVCCEMKELTRQMVEVVEVVNETTMRIREFNGVWLAGLPWWKQFFYMHMADIRKAFP